MRKFILIVFLVCFFSLTSSPFRAVSSVFSGTYFKAHADAGSCVEGIPSDKYLGQCEHGRTDPPPRNPN
jgi:hypothetical protein